MRHTSVVTDISATVTGVKGLKKKKLKKDLKYIFTSFGRAVLTAKFVIPPRFI